jgi:Flp pilus assembly protein CpaB
MISRLSTLAATFAILATGTLAFAAGSHPTAAAAAASAKQIRIVELQPVVVTAKRLPAGS